MDQLQRDGRVGLITARLEVVPFPERLAAAANPSTPPGWTPERVGPREAIRQASNPLLAEWAGGYARLCVENRTDWPISVPTHVTNLITGPDGRPVNYHSLAECLSQLVQLDGAGNPPPSPPPEWLKPGEVVERRIDLFGSIQSTLKGARPGRYQIRCVLDLGGGREHVTDPIEVEVTAAHMAEWGGPPLKN